MAEYQRAPQRFAYTGMSFLPEDALPPGKVGFALNIRSYTLGTIQPRYGLIRQIDNGPLGGAIHSLFRMNDTTPFADLTAPQRRFGGYLNTTTGVGDLFEVAPGDNSAVILDSGYSGNPFTAVVAAPVNSPRPYIYFGDSARIRKVDGFLSVLTHGLASPPNEPSALLDPVNVTYLEPVNPVGGWAAYSGAAGAVASVSRINTTVSQFEFDSGGSGFASVALVNMAGITAGGTVTIDAEEVIIQDVLPPVAPTTIAAILYDVGTSGGCSIQPTGSFSVGQLEIPLPEEIRRRYEGLDQLAPDTVTVSRTIDFPVNALILLNGIEVVQITSIAIGPDGVQSFRCSTANTFAAGATITGIACFRADFAGGHAIGAPATAFAIQATITPPSADPFVAGVQTALTGGPINWGQINGAEPQASTPSDIIRVSVRLSQMRVVQYVRLMLNLGSNVPVYAKNYYFYEWRSNDLFTAIQTAIGNSTALISAAQGGAVEQGQQDAAFRPGYGQESSAAVSARGAAPGRSVIDPNAPLLQGGSVSNVIRSALTAQQRVMATDGFVSVGSTPSRQLALGDDEWITLFCRVGDLTRVGTDTTLTLASLTDAAVVAQFDDATTPITMEVSVAYLTGGYGPDVGATLAPIVYRYRYRSTITGERSNPSPSMRAGVRPHRGRVRLTGAANASSQCDTIDWFRFGGALARWAYVGSSGNSAAPFLDTREDRQIDGGETLRADLYQPWPSYDLPRSGTCNVAGTSVLQASGDDFDVDWAPDSIIIINGRATSLYRSPASASRLEVIDNVGSGTGVTFSLPSPTLLAQPLPYIWGGPINNTWFLFACGDRADPSRILWSHGNDPDSTSDRNTLVVTSASEPLINGFFYDGVPYVFSSNRLYRIVPTFGGISDFIAQETPCTKGLWSPWAFCVTPEGGVYFLSNDGIYFTQAGGEAVNISDPDLQPFFPNDGVQTTVDIRGIPPPDFARIANLKMTYVDGLVYFDYFTEDADGLALIYDPAVKGWTVDVYRSDITARMSEPGPQVEGHVIGLENGELYQFDENATDDAGSTFNWQFWTPHLDGGDPRADKQWGDLIVDAIPGSNGYTVTPVANNGSDVLGATTVTGSAVAARQQTVIEINNGDGQLARNFGVRINGQQTAADGLPRPQFYLWEPSFVPKQPRTQRRSTDWENLNYVGAKFIQGVVIRANTFGAEKQIEVQFEGGHVGAQLTLLHDGETQYAYPLEREAAHSANFPFTAELVRLAAVDDLPWALYDWRWVWEPEPEASTHWQTQRTTYDAPGFVAVADVVLAYRAFCPVTLRVYHDHTFVDYTFPASTVSGQNVLYSREYQRLEAAKGKSTRFEVFADSPFRLYKRDCSVRVQRWGAGEGYLQATPFGGPHREDGAAI